MAPSPILASSAQIPAYFVQMGLIFLPRSRPDSARLQKYSWKKSPYYKANAAEFKRLTDQYGEQLEAGFRAPLSLAQVSDSVGLGVFAESDLAPDALIGEYTGVIREARDAPPVKDATGHFLSDYAWNYPDELPDGTEFEIDASQEGNELRFVNHSFLANVVVDHTLVNEIFVTFFKALKPISAGQQLLIDYGEDYWSGGFRTLEVL